MAKYIDAGKLKYEIERRNLSDHYMTTERYEEELYEIIDSLEDEQHLEGLEEAANKWGLENQEGFCTQSMKVAAFKAGAEWQKKQDDLETADLLAIAHLQGMEQQKSNMLEEAVDGLVEELYNDGESQCTVGVGTYFKPGEEVYVIKKED